MAIRAPQENLEPATVRRRVWLLRRALYLPLLAVLFIALSFVALFNSGVHRTSVWIERSDVSASLHIATSGHGLETQVIGGDGAAEEPPAGCGRAAARISAETDDPAIGNTLLDRLAAAGIRPCSGLETEFNVTPSGSNSLAAPATGWLAFVVLLLGAIATTWVYRKFGPHTPRLISARSHLRHVLAGLVGAFLVYLCSSASGAVFSQPGLAVTNAGISLFPMVSMALLIPYLEELSFRAWLLPLASKAIGAGGAILFSASSFALVHGSYDPMHLAFYASAGIVLALIWMRTQSLLACVVAHGVYNAGIPHYFFG